MNERFLERFVAVLVLDILADDADPDLILGVVGAVDQVAPLAQVGVSGIEAEVLEGERIDAFRMEVQRNLIDARGRPAR